MSKLTNTQRTVLSGAAAREGGAAVVPAKMGKAASAKLAASLIRRKLMREVRTKRGMPVWRRGEDDGAFSLVITPIGRKMLGLEEQAGDARMDRAAAAASIERTSSNKRTTALRAAGAAKSAPDKARRPNPRPTDKSRVQSDPAHSRSKRELLVDMLSRPDGATIDQMVQALGWLPHTTRAELTRLRQRGFSITRTPRQGQATLYSLAAPTPDAIGIANAA